MSLGYMNNERRTSRSSPRAASPRMTSDLEDNSTPASGRGRREKSPKTKTSSSSHATRSRIVSRLRDSKYPAGVGFLNAVLFLAHISIAIYISTVDFKFPVTVFRTELNESVIEDFTCIYDYGKNANEGGEDFCTDKTYTQSGNSTPPKSCIPSLDLYNSTSSLPALSQTGGPLISAFQLKRFTLSGGDADKEGKIASKWILFAIEMTTAVFHLVYVFLFAKLSSSPERISSLLEYGGLPARWLEYSITASLMTFFISNVANVFEFSSLLAISLSTFAVMYFGEAAERYLFQGYSQTSLKMLLVPGTALFLVPWVPSIQQIFMDVLKISCSNWESGGSWFDCDQTCFGKELPVPIFAGVLLILFCVFPLILLWKVYYLSYMEWWTGPTRRTVRTVCFSSSSSCTSFVSSFLLFLIHPFLFLLFIPYAGGVAFYRTVCDASVPFLPLQSVSIKADLPKMESAFWIGEILFALASATSKIFLAIYFLVFFSQRTW